MQNPRQKVVVYCVQGDNLLVFRHIDFPWEEVGIQVPAGSIREGEDPNDAALRELQEETGFKDFEIEAYLGADTYNLNPYRDEIQERHFFLARPTKELPQRWNSQEDHEGNEKPTRLECFWIPLRHAHVLQSGQGSMLYKVSI